MTSLINTTEPLESSLHSHNSKQLKAPIIIILLNQELVIVGISRESNLRGGFEKQSSCFEVWGLQHPSCCNMQLVHLFDVKRIFAPPSQAISKRAQKIPQDLTSFNYVQGRIYAQKAS